MSAPTPVSAVIRVAGSPLWLRLFDAHTGRPPVGPVEVRVELWRDGRWEPMTRPHHLTTAGDLGFVGLGRVRHGQSGTFKVRISVQVPKTQTAMPSGSERLVVTLPLWSDASPPSPAPRTVTFFPTPDYSFGPSTPLIAGRVLDAAGGPVSRAEVSVTETVRGVPVRERTLSDLNGWFRLPVRWSAGTTRLDAVRDLRTGSHTFEVPDDLATIATVTVT